MLRFLVTICDSESFIYTCNISRFFNISYDVCISSIINVYEPNIFSINFPPRKALTCPKYEITFTIASAAFLRLKYFLRYTHRYQYLHTPIRKSKYEITFTIASAALLKLKYFLRYTNRYQYLHLDSMK